MTTPSMEVGYVKTDGTLTYDGMALLQRLSTLGGAKDFAITSPAAGQVMLYDGDKWVNSSGSVRVLLATRTASASATLDFTEFSNSVYRRYEFELENVLLATDNIGLFMRFSTNGGSSYDNAASDYSHARTQKADVAEDDTGDSAGAGSIALVNGIGNAAGEQGVTGIVRIWGAGSAVRTTARWELHTFDAAAGHISLVSGVGARLANQDTDALRFLPTSGNITSGTIRMFGIV